MNDRPKPPVAPERPHVETIHGERRVDPYHWMRERDDPEVVRHLEAENAYTEAMTSHTTALRQRLYDEMLGRIKQTDLTVPQRIRDWFYYSRTEEGQQYRIYCRRHGGLEAAEQVILDQNALAEGQEYCGLGGMAVSPEHDLLAYAVDFSGNERYTIRVKNLRSGELLPDEIVNASDDLAWANDNRTLFYTTLDQSHRPWHLHRHLLGTDPAADPLLYEESDGKFFLGLHKTRSRRYLLLTSASKTSTEVHYLNADTPDDEFRPIEPRRPDLEYYVEHQGERFLVLTNERAVNFRLVEAPVAEPGRAGWRERIAHRPAVMLESVEAFRDHVVVVEREEGLRRLRVVDVGSGRQHHVSFPEPAYAVYVAGNPEYDTTLLRFSYTSLVTPESVYDYDMNSRERELKKQVEVLGGYDPADYRSERVHATAPDGTRVPISLVHSRRFRRDGSHPCELYGYGSYGLSSEPVFSSERLSLLDRGFVCAIAHVRGGGDCGRPWYEAGKLLNKQNTFDDFIACAEHLVREGYTSADRLVIRGGSAGGLLMGAVLNRRPDLFRVVVAKVPFVDVVNTMLDASLPLTVTEREEWGDPRDRHFYEYIRAYSPYDKVEPHEYPEVLVTSGLHDPRVQYWEPAKWVAKLRKANRGNSVILLKTNMGAGHSGASGRYEALEERAFEYAFILDRIGDMPHFQEKGTGQKRN